MCKYYSVNDVLLSNWLLERNMCISLLAYSPTQINCSDKKARESNRAHDENTLLRLPND